jgi:site-specific DNA-methyltransferase (adenine-specific)
LVQPAHEGDPVSAPYWRDDAVTLYLGDCRELLDAIQADIDQPILVVTDPPYGETSLEWDMRPRDWLQHITANSLWCFGSMRMFMAEAPDFEAVGYAMSQDIVWEKHNGSNFHADRFRRVHEHVVHFYRGPWGDIYATPPKTMDATARTVRRKGRPPHTGHIEASAYASEDGGPRLMRSVIYCRSAHGTAVHPTQKPEGIIRPLIEYGSREDMVVLDPFAGSGSTGIAARELGRRAVLIEKDERYAEAAARRLSQLSLLATAKEA